MTESMETLHVRSSRSVATKIHSSSSSRSARKLHRASPRDSSTICRIALKPRQEPKAIPLP